MSAVIRVVAIRKNESLNLRYEMSQELDAKFENRWIYLYHKPEHSDVAGYISIKINGVEVSDKQPADGHSGTKAWIGAYVRPGVNRIAIGTSSKTDAIVVKQVVVKYFPLDSQ